MKQMTSSRLELKSIAVPDEVANSSPCKFFTGLFFNYSNHDVYQFPKINFVSEKEKELTRFPKIDMFRVKL